MGRLAWARSDPTQPRRRCLNCDQRAEEGDWALVGRIAGDDDSLAVALCADCLHFLYSEAPKRPMNMPTPGAIVEVRDILFEMCSCWATGPLEHDDLKRVLRLLGDDRDPDAPAADDGRGS